MKHLLIFLSCLVFVFLGNNNLLAQTSTNKMEKTYDKQWKKVRQFQEQGLPKSAKEVVQAIEKQAKAEKNEVQQLKVMMYLSSLSQEYEENATAATIISLEKELTTASLSPSKKSVLHSLLGYYYQNYLNENRWNIYDNSTVAQKTTAAPTIASLAGLSINQLSEKTLEHYVASLSNSSALQAIKIESFDAITTGATEQNRKLNTTLYDMVALRAIDALNNSELFNTRPAYQFYIDKPEYFALAPDFVKLKLPKPDSLAPYWYVMQTYQQLSAFRLKNNNLDALADIELRRLAFVNAKYPDNDQKAKLYNEAIIKAVEFYKNSDWSTRFSYLLAEYYNQQGNYVKAHNICQEAAEQPSSVGTNQCSNLLASIKAVELNTTGTQIVPPNLPQLTLLEYRNIKKTVVSIFPISRTERAKLQNYQYENDSFKRLNKILGSRAPQFRWVVNLPDSSDYKKHSTEIKIPALAIGHYLIVYSDKADFRESNMVHTQEFQVSALSLLLRSEQHDIQVNDRETGQALPNIDVAVRHHYYDHKQQKSIVSEYKNLKTNAEGYAEIPRKSNGGRTEITLSSGNDTLYDASMYDGGNYYYSEPTKLQQKLVLFTDRAIYRPMQTVFFKAILIEKGQRDQAKVLADKPITVRLSDVNGQEVFTKQYTTNSFGSISGSIALPAGALNGTFSLMAFHDGVHAYASVLVEEYKRPKFEATWQPVEGSFRLGDSLSVVGKAQAFAGFGLDNATVTYTITRTAQQPHFWWDWWRKPSHRPSASTLIASDTIKTDAKGLFTIKFTALPDLNESKDTEFSFSINADITDQNGETHSLSKELTISRAALSLSANIDPKVNIEKKVDWKISAMNMASQPVPTQGQARLYRIVSPEKATRERMWAMPDAPIIGKEEFVRDFPYDQPYSNAEPQKTLLQTITFDTKKESKLLFSGIETMPVGIYFVELEAKDQYNTVVKTPYMFELTAPHGTKLAKPVIFEAQLLKNTLEPTEIAKILLASSEKDLSVLYEVEHDGKIISRQILKLNNEQRIIQLPIKEEYRGNIAVHFNAVRHNRSYSQNLLINVPYSNKDLKISFATFRNKLLPNEKETWKLKISGHKADKVAAEMVATLYDASLETFAAHSLDMNLFDSYYQRIRWSANQIGTTVGSVAISLIPQRNYDVNIDDSYENFAEMPRPPRVHLSKKAKGSSLGDNEASYMKEVVISYSSDGRIAASSAAMAKSLAFAPPVVAADEEIVPAKPKVEPKTEAALNVQARKNFNETAFFLPHLQTNELGEIIVNFTIPESLTRWKMLGLAHTKNMDFGTTSNELITQKTLMVTPNMPRFLREDDTIWLAAKITNLSDNVLKGKVQLQLFDALTQKPIDNELGNKANTYDFHCEATLSTNVKFKITIPVGTQAISYKIVAQAANFSDGEEAVLPVLTNRMLVTEAMPLPIRGKQTKVFEMKKLTGKASPTARNQGLTLEFTQNPAWYAVQALPYLMEYPYECAEQTFSRFYANSLAFYIVEKNPKIKAVFEQWKTSDSSAFLSNLEKNQELKSLLLQETPWLAQANKEEASKKQLALLFDVVKMSAELNSALAKLEKMQYNDGSFPWFTDMPGNRYITQHIVAGLGHLVHLNVLDLKEKPSVNEMLSKAITYLDGQLQKDYDELRKIKGIKLEEQHIGHTQIHYLYVRSYFAKMPLKGGLNKKTFEYFEKQLATYWRKQPIYVQGMSALTLHRTGNKETAKAIVASLREKSLNSEEMGMYWRANRSYYWYEAPIETQALMIEVFDEVANDNRAVENLKVWLIKNKQTNDWKTTKATAEACYALLLKGANWLTETQPIEITLGNERVAVEKLKQEAGTGYFKKQFTGEEVKPEMGKVTVTKRDEGVAWGALYWQYFEQLDRITVDENPLKMTKTLYKKELNERGQVLVAITEKSPLQVGDIVRVRVELEADRAMEYVHLKDLRAASFEPIESISGYHWQGGLGYYQTMKDASANFFIGYLPKGNFVFEYDLRVAQSGSFSNGITTIQCMYAPEFATHSEGIRVNVK